MQSEHASTVAPIEIACDESGSEGEKLVGGNTDVFAHASVRLDTETAALCVREIRDRIRSPATEYKANHLLRAKHRSVLRWLLGSSAPILGNAHVYLIDKPFFAVARIVDLLVDTTADPGQVAGALYREGRTAFGAGRWQAFLAASNELMRIRNRWGDAVPVDTFFRTADALAAAGTGQAGALVELLRQGRSRADSFRARLLDDPAAAPTLDPLIPAIVRTVEYWSDGGRPVSLVHDETNALTTERVAHLEQVLGRHRLAGLTMVDSRSDPRVQLADFLAGVARKLAENDLNGQGDAELTAALRPYVDSHSIWGDDRSWSALGPVSPGVV